MLAEVVPPAGPVMVPALAGLFILAGLLFAIGALKLVDALVNMLVAVVNHLVRHLPFVGALIGKQLHRLEQIVSNVIGTAERKLDGYVALTWHTMARLVHLMGHEIEGAAVSAWHLAMRARHYVHRGEMNHAIRAGVAPVKAQAIGAQRVGRLARGEAHAVARSVAQGVYPRIRAGEATDRTVVMPGLKTARAEAKAAEDAAIASYKYLTKHKTSLLTGAFTGAAAWALTRLGGGWIRCANWRKIGKRVCRMPTSLIDSILGLALATELIVDPEAVAKAALVLEDGFEDVIKRIAK